MDNIFKKMQAVVVVENDISERESEYYCAQYADRLLVFMHGYLKVIYVFIYLY